MFGPVRPAPTLPRGCEFGKSDRLPDHFSLTTSCPAMCPACPLLGVLSVRPYIVSKGKGGGYFGQAVESTPVSLHRTHDGRSPFRCCPELFAACLNILTWIFSIPTQCPHGMSMPARLELWEDCSILIWPSWGRDLHSPSES